MFKFQGNKSFFSKILHKGALQNRYQIIDKDEEKGDFSLKGPETCWQILFIPPPQTPPPTHPTSLTFSKSLLFDLVNIEGASGFCFYFPHYIYNTFIYLHFSLERLQSTSNSVNEIGFPFKSPQNLGRTGRWPVYSLQFTYVLMRSQ